MSYAFSINVNTPHTLRARFSINGKQFTGDGHVITHVHPGRNLGDDIDLFFEDRTRRPPVGIFLTQLKLGDEGQWLDAKERGDAWDIIDLMLKVHRENKGVNVYAEFGNRELENLKNAIKALKV